MGFRVPVWRNLLPRENDTHASISGELFGAPASDLADTGKVGLLMDMELHDPKTTHTSGACKPVLQILGGPLSGSEVSLLCLQFNQPVSFFQVF